MDDTAPPTSTAAPSAGADRQPEPRDPDWFDPAASAAEQAAAIRALLENPEWLIPATPADSGSRATRIHGQAPANIAAISDLADQAAEIQAFLAVADAAGEIRTRPSSTSGWYAAADQAAGTAGPDVQRELEILAWRHTAQAAIRIGDTRPISHTRCPGCSTWGLRWLPSLTPHDPQTPLVVVCLNRRCRQTGGRRRTFTLHQIAALRIQPSRTAIAN